MHIRRELGRGTTHSRKSGQRHADCELTRSSACAAKALRSHTNLLAVPSARRYSKPRSMPSAAELRCWVAVWRVRAPRAEFAHIKAGLWRRRRRLGQEARTADAWAVARIGGAAQAHAETIAPERLHAHTSVCLYVWRRLFKNAPRHVLAPTPAQHQHKCVAHAVCAFGCGTASAR